MRIYCAHEQGQGLPWCPSALTHRGQKSNQALVCSCKGPGGLLRPQCAHAQGPRVPTGTKSKMRTSFAHARGQGLA